MVRSGGRSGSGRRRRRSIRELDCFSACRRLPRQNPPSSTTWTGWMTRARHRRYLCPLCRCPLPTARSPLPTRAHRVHRVHRAASLGARSLATPNPQSALFTYSLHYTLFTHYSLTPYSYSLLSIYTQLFLVSPPFFHAFQGHIDNLLNIHKYNLK